MNERGQILLPGLAWFLGLLTAFAMLVAWGEHTLHEERMETAAMSAALSAARTQAYLLNQRATHNLLANGFVNLRYKGYGAMEADKVGTFEDWLEVEGLQRSAEDIHSYMNGLKGYPAVIGHQVAKLNGARKSRCRSSLDLRLKLNDLDVFVFFG